MNIWRIAGTVAAFCALTVVAFYVSSGKLESWNFHNIHGMIGSASFAALFTFTIVLFPYYWLKMMLGFFSFWSRGNVQNKPQKPNNDTPGILILLFWSSSRYGLERHISNGSFLPNPSIKRDALRRPLCQTLGLLTP